MSAKEYLKEMGISIDFTEEEALQKIIESHRKLREVMQFIAHRGVDKELFDKFFNPFGIKFD